MAIKVYVHGKESFAKRAKSAEEFVIDPDFLVVAEAHEQHLDNLLGEFLEQRDREKREEKEQFVHASQERVAAHR